MRRFQNSKSKVNAEKSLKRNFQCLQKMFSVKKKKPLFPNEPVERVLDEKKAPMHYVSRPNKQLQTVPV